jgi:colanic acid biosynthesis glycosyl transferase WcaI
MRVLAICPHFEPDTAPTGVVMTRIVRELLGLGVDVDVVTSLPWYRNHAVEPEWRGKPMRRAIEPGLTVTRLHPFPSNKGNLVARSVSFGAFTVEAAAWAVARGGRPDVVFAMSPPITLGMAGYLAAKRWRAPLVFNIQDVFPDAAVASGAITNQRVIRTAERLELSLYRKSAAVTVLSEDLAENVSNKLGRSGRGPGRSPRIEVIPNFVDTQAIQPADRATPYRDEFDLGDRVVVMYAGNVGHSQPLDLVLDAARHYRDRDDVVFVINGNGSERERLEAAAHDLTNVRFVDFQPAERLSEVLASADIHLVLLHEGLAAASVPSKMYSILAAGRPILASVDRGTEVQRTLETSNGGIATDAGDTDGFHRGLGLLIEQRQRREEMGTAAREWVEQWHAPRQVAEQYLALFAAVQGAQK